MTALTANTPEELYQAIGKFLQSNYSRENLVKMYDDTRKCAASFRGIYSALPILSARKSDPLDGLQYIMDWSKEASKVVDDIASNLEKQTISEVTSQLKKIRGFADSVLSLVDTKLKEQAQKEARAKVEKEYKNLNDKVSRLKLEKMLLIDQENILGELQLEEQEILRRETKEIVQIYLSKDPTFKDRLSQLNSEINEMLETLNKLVGSNTPTGKLLDIYCKLKDIPLQQQFDDVGYAYCPIDDLTDVICSGCNRLYTSVDNVIKTFEEIQMKAEQQIDETPPQTDLAKNGALERIKKEVDKTDQECLQEIIEVLKNFWEDKDFEAAELALPPIAKTYDILCRSRGQCGAKTTNIIKWLGSAANDGSGYCPALLKDFASPEVIADLEKWQEKPEEAGQRARDGGDTYKIIADHVSFGGKAQHAGRNIITQEPKKRWQKWVIILAAIATILMLFFGNNIWDRFNKKLKSKKRADKQLEAPKAETAKKEKIPQNDVNKTTTETKTYKKVEDITLLYLFENDFDNLLRASEDRILTDKDGSQTTVKSKLYLDFESQTEFVGFYIPPVPETFDICIHLAEHYKTALELAKKVMVESSGIGLQPVNISELKFSGRVFIYHEYPLLEAQKRELFTLYQKHDLSPQFRGTDYLFKKKEIEKSH